MCTAGLWGVARGSSALLRRTCGPYGVDDLTQFSPACGHLGLVVRGRALDGEALLFGLALLTQGLLLLVPAPDSRNALSQFRDELTSQGPVDQAPQVGDRAGMHRVCLHSGGEFVEQGLSVRRAALNQDKRRLPFFGKQAFGENQITTTLRAPLISDGLPCGWLLY